ncbi:LIPASE [Salix koriyanagi]|uniref:LIPASE n=1 Tax=Salix koriyanagi TaxID=2511006 RepID=A0A9Q0TGA5_9ROSI|nr:LIPASE [Salix koriyanagi]
MRKFCSNYDREYALDTVLEVPIPEEMFTKMGNSSASRWQNMRALMRAQVAADKSTHLQSKSDNEFITLLKLVGSPLIPFQVHPDQPLTRPLKDCTIEASTAKYIVQQYIAAIGGSLALNSVESMYAVGQVKMAASEMHQGDDSVHPGEKSEVGGFVLWQKDPDLWYLELAVSGYKVSAGSDGKVTWNQSSKPLAAGLDPRCTDNLFLEAVCVADKAANNEDCFLETDSNTLKAQSSSNTEIVHHTIWGYFSQRTGLLVKFEDTKLVKMKPIKGNDNVFGRRVWSQ